MTNIIPNLATGAMLLTKRKKPPKSVRYAADNSNLAFSPTPYSAVTRGEAWGQKSLILAQKFLSMMMEWPNTNVCLERCHLGD